MPRRLNLVHSVAEDRGPDSRGPILNRTGQAVQGHATFYVVETGWVKIYPGRLELADLWGGSSGFPNQLQTIRNAVEFYYGSQAADRYVAINADRGDVFTFGFFGTRYA